MRTETATRNGRPCRVTYQGNEEVREYLDGSDFNSGIRFGANFAGAMVYTEPPVNRPVPTITVHPPNTDPTKERAPIRRSTGEASHIEIVLRERAIEDMRHASTWGSGLDGKEVGGWVLGYRDGDCLVITNATSSSTERSPHELILDIEDAKEADHNAARGIGSPYIGLWHSHPSGSTAPSSTDYGCWESHLRHIEERTDVFVGLIVTPTDERGFASPYFNAYVVTRDGAGLTTKPADIRQED